MAKAPKDAATRAFTASAERAWKKVAKARQKIHKKANKIREARKEATRKVSLANKRARRLEANNLQDSEAYKQYLQGGGRFSVAGKNHNELQAEIARLNRFIESESSTVRGANHILKQTANITGIKYKNLQDLKRKASAFFEASSKIEQLLRQQEDMASAIGYQKIWQAVNEYVQQEKVDLSAGAGAIDDVIARVTDALKAYESPTNLPGGGTYRLLEDN